MSFSAPLADSSDISIDARTVIPTPVPFAMDGHAVEANVAAFTHLARASWFHHVSMPPCVIIGNDGPTIARDVMEVRVAQAYDVGYIAIMIAADGQIDAGVEGPPFVATSLASRSVAALGAAAGFAGVSCVNPFGSETRTPTPTLPSAPLSSALPYVYRKNVLNSSAITPAALADFRGVFLRIR